MQSLTLNELLEAGAHFGRVKAASNPQSRKYVYTIKDGVSIINLEKTLEDVKVASDYLKKMISSGKIVLFVGTKMQAKDIIKDIAVKAEMPYVNYRWLGGTITNFNTINKRIKDFNEKTNLLKNSQEKKMLKKEKLMIEKEINRMSKFFTGIKDLQKKPDLLFVIDPVEEHVAVDEAIKAKIPIIAIGNTNFKAQKATYPIIINDNSNKTLVAICNYFLGIISENKKIIKK